MSKRETRAETSRWRLRFSPRILREDLPAIGDAAFQIARKAITEKLATAPEQFGAPLRSPLVGMRKLRVQHVRIVYRVDVNRHEVHIFMIGARRDIWVQNQADIVERAEELRRELTGQVEAAQDAAPPARDRKKR
ncbi:MAG: type II toxin-antitoxin system RelE/ParE family toxin [Gemmatimonadaceae bacterium]|nr:type II toxin-antitoxin system RelE/ParE family toxin [Gemmatimonadaceae bacterium]